MLFAALFRERPDSPITLDNYLSRRMQGPKIGQAPKESRIEGVELLGEYWVHATDPSIILIFSAESDVPILELISEWDKVFDITVAPITKVEDLM